MAARVEKNTLDVFFSPRTIAVIGATEKPESVGRALLTNLLQSAFGGNIYPVNPKHESVFDIRAYPTISQVPEPGDLAILVTPAPTIPGLVHECATFGVKGALIISAGFKESGPEGAQRERHIQAVARNSGMRIIGPNWDRTALASCLRLIS